MNTGNTYSFDMYDADRLDGVRTRRVLSFCVDYLLIALLTFMAGIVVFFLGIFTLGLGWLLYLILAPLVAMTYVGFSMGGPRQATPGMRFFAIRIERDDGQFVDPFMAVLHGVLFWVAHITLTPFLLLVGLFSSRKRLLHDILLGTCVVRSDV